MVVKELFAKLGMDLDAASFAEADIAVRTVVKGLEIIGEVAKEAAKGFVELFAKTTEYAGHINDLSERTGLSIQALQELRYAGSLAGVGLDELVGATTILSSNMAQAAAGSASAQAAFKKLGVQWADSSGKLRDVNDVMDDMAVSFGGMQKGAEKTDLARTLMGRGGAGLLPMMKAGAGGLKDMREEANLFGNVMSDEMVASGDDFGDNLTRIGAILEGLRNAIAGPLLDDLRALSQQFIDWVKANRDLIKQRTTQVVEGLRVVLNGTVTVVKALMGVFSHWRAILVTVTAAAVVFGFVWLSLVAGSLGVTLAELPLVALAFLLMSGSAIKAALSTAIAWLGAVLPLLLAVGIVALLILAFEDLYTGITGGDSVLGDFWAALMDTDTAWAVKNFFRDLKASAVSTWDTLGGFSGIWDTAVDTWKQLFSSFWAWLKSGFVDAVASVPGGSWLMDKLGSGTPAAGPAPAPAPPTAAYFGGGASPAATASMSSNSTANSLNFQPSINAPISISAGPGVDSEAIATDAATQLEKVLQRQYSEAFQAVDR
jgi:hypothetical protein